MTIDLQSQIQNKARKMKKKSVGIGQTKTVDMVRDVEMNILINAKTSYSMESVKTKDVKRSIQKYAI